MPTVTSRTLDRGNAALATLISRHQDLATLRDKLTAMTQRRDDLEQRISDVAAQLAGARRDLASATSDAKRKTARDTLAGLTAEATVLVDEAVIASEARAVALHRWAEAALNRIATTERDARHVARQAEVRYLDEHQEELEPDPNETGSTTAARIHAQAGRVANAAYNEAGGNVPLDRARRAVYDETRSVFGMRQIGELDQNGQLTGHHQHLNRVRAVTEERLRA